MDLIAFVASLLESSLVTKAKVICQLYPRKHSNYVRRKYLEHPLLCNIVIEVQLKYKKNI